MLLKINLFVLRSGHWYVYVFFSYFISFIVWLLFLPLTVNKDFHISAPKAAILQLRFDFDSNRQSGHHDIMLVKARIHTRRHFTSELYEKAIPTSMLPDVDPSA